LQGYDTEKRIFIIEGFSHGFHIPFSGALPQKHPPNLVSAHQHPNVVDEKISTELAAGRIAGPFTDPPFRNFVISPIGVVPKKTAGTFRLIHHLSYPRGGSINSGIDSGDLFKDTIVFLGS